jgi:hypothetical protein
MATPSAHIALGTVKGGFPILDTKFTSIDLVPGDVYTITNSNFNYMVMSSQTNLWVAFTFDGSTPNPEVNPRFYITADTLCPFFVSQGTKIVVAEVV